MKVVDTFYRKEFISNSEKGAYLKAVKFIFKIFFREGVNRKKIENMSMYIDKSYEGEGYKMVIEIGLSVDIREELNKKCLRCTEVHRLPWFEAGALEKCNTCKCNSLLTQTQKQINVKKSYLRERVDYLIEKFKKERDTAHYYHTRYK